MNEHPDPTSEATARAAQLAAMTVSVAEALARLRAQRLQSEADLDRRAETAARANARGAAAQASLQYRQALSPEWVRSADSHDLLVAWHCATPYLDNPLARTAMSRIEHRLTQLHPEAMGHYSGIELRGLPMEYRMQQASLLLRGPYGLDPVGTPVTPDPHLTGEEPVAAAERAWAASAMGTPDYLSTPGVDERTSAQADASAHHGRAAANHTHATTRPDVVTVAFPIPMQAAMASAPRAAAGAVKAITAPPVRKQLTATATASPRSTR